MSPLTNPHQSSQAQARTVSARSSLTIVCSVTENYAKYLGDWARSIAGQTSLPHSVCIFSHGSQTVPPEIAECARILTAAAIPVLCEHEIQRLDFGSARNRAVGLSRTEWVMHFDADDELMPHALAEFERCAVDADIVAFGYERSGDLAAGPANRTRRYSSLVGRERILASAAPCSGVSPFRRALWEMSPYRTDMSGGWDTALWLGFAHLELPRDLRIKATPRPVFFYRQHRDSIFNKRRKANDWPRAHTEAMLGALRIPSRGVSVIVPRAVREQPDRALIWRQLNNFWSDNFPQWQIVEGVCPGSRWNKSLALRNALSRARGEILVIADADVLVSAGAIREAVEAVSSGRYPWAVPHRMVHRMSQAWTASHLSGEMVRSVPDVSHCVPDDYHRRPYEGFAGGGLLVVPRVSYVACGGIPEPFEGWGAEDQALAVILDTCIGRHYRGEADLVHFYHAEQPSKRGPERSRNQILLRGIRRKSQQGRDVLIPWLRAGMPRHEGGEASWRIRQRAVADRLARERVLRKSGGRAGP